MPKLYTENALMAKVKAIYGKRLTEADYRALMQKKSVGELTAYLKQTTYESSLAEVKDELVHRGQLETLIKRHKSELFLRLIKYNYQDNLASSLYKTQIEIDQLLLALRLLNSKSMERYVATFPAYLSNTLSFDLFELAKVRTYDQMLDVLKHSDYYEILGNFRPLSSAKGIDIPGGEQALLTYYYNKAVVTINQNFHFQTRKDLLDIMNMHIYIHNIKVIYRMKAYFNATPEAIRSLLISIKAVGKIPDNLLDKMVNAQTIEQVIESLAKIPVINKHLPTGADNIDFEISVQHFKQYYCKKLFRYSIKPVVVMMSFMLLQEIEIENIINIIEGIRYALPVESLRKLLIL